ncbi:MAG: hypothetical protein CMJ34_08110 [Phycisphaerae bacterium]|nr:hypothetical protein [Phycisphaerae bacterium]
MIDDDPTDEDVDRFSSQTGYCPDCGGEVWDEAWQCPHCGAVVEDRIRRERHADPVSRHLSSRTIVLLVVILVVILLFMQFR